MDAHPRHTSSSQTTEDFLRTVPLFKGCDPSVIARVAPHVEVAEHAQGATILRAGVPSDGVVILRSGKASTVAVNAATGATSTLETLLPGDHAGELSALLKAAQPHTLVADAASVTLRLRADLVDTLATKVPGFALALARRLAMRAIQLGVSSLRAGSPTMAPPAAAPSAIGPRELAAPAKGAKVISFVEVSEYDVTPKVIAMVPSKIILLHRMIPLRVTPGGLTVGMVNPRNTAALAELQHVLQRVEFEVVAISVDDYLQALTRFRIEAPHRDGPRGDGVTAESLGFEAVDATADDARQVRVIGDEVVRALNRVIAAGLSREASDIHIEPEAAGVRVRFRVNGVLNDWSETMPASFARGMVARVKILAGLDITERRFPQDGRIGMTAGTRELDLRISTMPTGRGEKVVIRVLEGGGMMRPLEQVFVDPAVLAVARRAIQRPYGGVLIAGGTGSGKSSTLYAMIHERRKVRPDSAVIMVEDPIEYRLQGVTQVQVNPAIGLGFAQVLRATLRQDPDVIAVGETRDKDTAHTALEAAMTGHLLLTSLHANDAASVLQRLENLECSRTLLAQSIAVILAQRLVRRLCGQCARVEAPPPAIVESLVARRLMERGSSASLPRAVGCDACNGTGYAGRVLVIESLQMTDATRDALMAGHALGEIEKTACAAGSFLPFSAYASQLMVRRMISASEALLAVAD
jgi:type II secretory ATPase GspE/PulE/Tfp pilus assembly ATPase PilB-like protein